MTNTIKCNDYTIYCTDSAERVILVVIAGRDIIYVDDTCGNMFATGTASGLSLSFDDLKTHVLDGTYTGV